MDGGWHWLNEDNIEVSVLLKKPLTVITSFVHLPRYFNQA